MARSRETKIELTAYDDLFQTDESREEAKLSKIRDIPITLSTVMQNIIDDKTLDVSHGIIHHSEGVDLLPSNIELSGFEVRLKLLFLSSISSPPIL